MCGISCIISPNPDRLKGIFDRREQIKKTIERRGPDAASVARGDNFFALHTLLSMTGFGTQPVLTDRFMLVYNGEIYNDYVNYTAEYGDTQFLTSRILERGAEAFHGLDGEFAICCFDFTVNTLYLVTDPFASKPLYYQLGADYCIAGTYESTVAAAGQGGSIRQVPANTLLEVNLDDFCIRSTKGVRPFDFSHQNVDSFERWNEAFANAIRKRATNPRRQDFVSLSSGLDSGLIVAELLRLEIPFTCYIVPYKEDQEVLQKRVEILDARHVPYEIIEPSEDEYWAMHRFLHKYCEAFQLVNTETGFRNFKDPDMRNVPGYVVSAIIHQKARAANRLISFVGQGGDEIYADYYNPPANPAMSDLKGDWEKATRPWPNFYAGWNRVFLGAGERIAGLFGIETRYPFLDYDVVQEFLNLRAELKARYYKSPITNRLQELSFPYHLRKFGFAGFPAPTDPV